MKTLSMMSVIVMLALPTPALARESGTQKGQWDLDIKPFEGIGFGFQLSDRFSVRPLFGGVRPAETGNQFTLGVDLRYELTQRTTFAPYLLGTLSYGRNYVMQTDTGSSVVPRSGEFGLGVGLRQPISNRWSLFGEVTLQHSTVGHSQGIWNQIQFSDRDALRFGFGVTFNIRK